MLPGEPGPWDRRSLRGSTPQCPSQNSRSAPRMAGCSRYPPLRLGRKRRFCLQTVRPASPFFVRCLRQGSKPGQGLGLLGLPSWTRRPANLFRARRKDKEAEERRGKEGGNEKKKKRKKKERGNKRKKKAVAPERDLATIRPWYLRGGGIQAANFDVRSKTRWLIPRLKTTT